MITRDELGAILTIDELRALSKFILDHYDSLFRIAGMLGVYRKMQADGIFKLYNGFKDLIADQED